MRRLSCGLVVLGLVGCGRAAPPPPQPGSGSGGGGAAAPGSAPTPALVLYVDDAEAAQVTARELASWPRVDTLVAPAWRRLGTWRAIYLKTGEATVELAQPSTTYPDLVPAVFPGPDGSAAFGMFDPVELAQHGTPVVRHDTVTELRIARSTAERGGDHQGGDVAADPRALALEFQVGARTQTLTGEALLALPREPMPGSDEHKGWRLTALLAAVGVKQFKRLVLVDAGGTSLVLERAELDDATRIPFVKLNRQGALRFRVLARRGTGWQASGDLRALTRIKVD